MDLNGFHHLTAITAEAAKNNHFYTHVLGMRRSKKTVNQDDVSAYHLYFTDGAGSPGTDITFFDWPVPHERRGRQSISRTGFRIRAESFDFWRERLRAEKVTMGDIRMLDGRQTFDFEDPEGQRFRFTADTPTEATHPWERSTVPAEHQIFGLGPISISVGNLGPTEQVLTEFMKGQKLRQYESPDGGGTVHVFQIGGQGPAGELHVAVQPHLPLSQQGAGGVHHVAFRVPNLEALHHWAKRLMDFRIPNSGEVERYYFRSLYFREPAGNLFEIATDTPGFAVDEPFETMGEGLSLPAPLEKYRQEIEAGLKPID